MRLGTNLVRTPSIVDPWAPAIALNHVLLCNLASASSSLLLLLAARCEPEEDGQACTLRIGRVCGRSGLCVTLGGDNVWGWRLAGVLGAVAGGSVLVSFLCTVGCGDGWSVVRVCMYLYVCRW